VLYAALIVAALLTLECVETRRTRVPSAGGTATGRGSTDRDRLFDAVLGVGHASRGAGPRAGAEPDQGRVDSSGQAP
jgi:hypothetical protein